MTDDWRERMEEANAKWLRARTSEYPIRVELPGEQHDEALSIANGLNVAFAHAKLPLAGVRVFLFKTEHDAERFKEAMNGTD